MRIVRTRAYQDALASVMSKSVKVYDKCCGLLNAIEHDLKTVRKIRSDDRLQGEVKYELGDGYRVVLQRGDQSLIALTVGTHDEVERFLSAHRSRNFTQTEDRQRSSKERTSVHAPQGNPSSRLVTAPVVTASRHTPIFDSFSSDVLLQIGVPARLVPAILNTVDSDSPAFQTVLSEIAIESNDVAYALLNYAVERSDENDVGLRRLIGRESLAATGRELAPSVEVESKSSELVSTLTQRDVVMSESPQVATVVEDPDSAPSPPQRKKRAVQVSAKKKRAVQAPAKKHRKAAKGSMRLTHSAAAARGARPRRTGISPKTRHVAKRSPISSRVPRRTTNTLPKRITFSTLRKYLKAKNFPLVDRRSSGGGVWVMADQRQFASVARHLEMHGVQSKFFPSGSRKRVQRASWLIDPFRRIREA